VEKYATPLMLGAIAPYGSKWVIRSNEVRLNHGAGIKAGSGQPGDDYERILSNNVHNNGQEGIAVGGGTGTIVEYNTISNNDFAYVLSEFGGGKIAATVNAQVINNIYSNNNGVGLWGDGGATGTIFSGNTVVNSQLEVLFLEACAHG
jgi:parallel beta-helix repeat protein